MTPDHLAKEADRLRHDTIFQKALADIRSEALEALVAADADSFTAIARLQQKVAVVDEIRAMLDRYVMAAGRSAQDEASPFA